MKKGISASVLTLLLTLPGFALAEILTVTVPDQCTVIDTESNQHTFSGQYLGICALAAAKEQGAVGDYTLQNFSFGLFLQSLNSITPGETEFWNISLNGTEAAVGLSDLVVMQNDALSFQLTDWTANTAVGPPVLFKIALLASAPNAPAPSSGGGGDFLKDRVFNVESAFDFLVSTQHTDGSFGSPMLTDWAAIAFGAAVDEVCNDACPAAREKLRTYVASATVSTSSATELERHIMALEALGIDPYVVTGSPVDALVSKFDGTQMGEESLVNDDIFSLFPLLHAGYANNDSLIEAVVAFILSKQKQNGSWEDSVDLTAAAIQALRLSSDDSEAVERAREFLRRNQDDSGIFGRSSFSLSWVLQAIAALGETPQDWKKSNVTPLGYLGVLQQDDGGVESMSVSEETRVWATSYAIPAAFGKPWGTILKNFSRPIPPLPPPLVEVAASATPITQAPPPSPSPAAKAVPSSVTFAKALSTTTTGGTTSAQVAAVGESTDAPNNVLLWLAGLLLVLGTGAYFVRSAK
ncbi:hypothetical protein HY417_00195 [Candidatus Kaiserbacteria bacterium]|nr:hypothetical protein [Candidatus Kaiserbacteria bacterium]